MKDLRPRLAGNWKMIGLGSAVAQARGGAASDPARARVAICAPATLAERLVERRARAVAGSDLVGRSERRSACGETDDLVERNALTAVRGGLEPIICVGEGPGRGLF
jgi:triosephosphate isomerase